MLSAPVKSAKRISSLFNLGGSTKDHGSSSSSPTGSPDHIAVDAPRGSSRSARHVSSPHVLSSESRASGSGPADDLDLNEPLPPPPSLLAVNQDLANSAGNSSNGRPQSRGRPSTSGGLAPPGSRSGSRPGTPTDHKNKRRSWMPGRTRASSVDNRPSVPMPADVSTAWVAGLEQKVVYDLGPLARGEPIAELWNEQGDTFVYLFPQTTNRPPSFKVDSSVFAASPLLTYLAHGKDPKMDSLRQSTKDLSLGGPASPPLSPQERFPDFDTDSAGSGRIEMVDDAADEQPLHLYIPIPLESDVSNQELKLTPQDTEMLLVIRNLFAFLLGQALIATPGYPDLFTIFMEVSHQLTRYEFSNLDGSNFGETATSSFANYCDELRLADVRHSREKTIEAMILGEGLRYYPLYLEGFVHGVGKLDELKQLNSIKYAALNPVTKKRLERGYMDLNTRVRTMKFKLEDFDFPSLWAGIANSNMAAESKVVRFKAWKASFLSFRKHIMQYYRQKFGSWPPKSNAKKNGIDDSGLNRLILKELYDDFADLYDMIVDRTSLTTRTTDSAGDTSDSPDQTEQIIRALRQMMSEYDRSSPPVLPPIPFDIPQLPNLTAVRRKPMDAKKEAKERTKRLKDSDINEILMGSYTRESLKPTPFVESFMQFERRSAHGKSLDDICDLRCGQWLFLYAVIQALPMLVVDAADVVYTEGVEYFLCVAPRGGAPWIHNDGKAARSWFGVAGGQGVVSLPTDIVTNGVEGTYRRSHCWQVAMQWAETDEIMAMPMPDDNDTSSFSSPPPAPLSSVGSVSDVQPTPLLSPGNLPIPRSTSPAGSMRQSRRLSIHPGLEALPLPMGVSPLEPPARPVSRGNPGMSFDDILKDMPQKGKK
ncbi:hypothetical protein DTO166G4_477 [Paecilomyces variotii]|uniref:DUF8004 domain-containing protein n=1 Tax=Byssochlamys spectabilis TaxID=264951 RepID=A0A443HKJ3_BYSSP|nr:hypothetical protein C8Q69DRAFT_407985 [Paecilomyces variotii]KAJ9196000.1 hypothetical protein DTO164E3_6538 [Paecilomyces variotii]KAJ9197456.1 hypothetical protein DTO032I3_5938 [Paecilomyces variotii]KAJ9218086.1 hypothetical protein DTO166G4_477 [Paecilomyces variotii]KAJ9222817.1 hypothetical protein DTO169C6_4832 [Paecilomyces variotii]KAJ9235044.1 hypothetical protein DTO166G5_4865 [Paecilomyces variotii]